MAFNINDIRAQLTGGGARSNLFQDTGKTSPVTTTGQNIQAIESIVGSYDLLATGVSVYAQSNADDTLDFGGLANNHRLQGTTFSWSMPIDMVIVGKRGTGTNSLGYFQTGAAGDEINITSEGAGADLGVDIGVGTKQTITGGGIGATTTLLYLVCDGASSQLYDQDNVQIGSNFDLGSAPVTIHAVGSNTGTANGEFYEWGYKLGGNTAGDRATVLSLLRTEYGL